MTTNWPYWPALVLAAAGTVLLVLADLLSRADRRVCAFANVTDTCQ